MKNRFLLLVNKLWQKQRLFIQTINHFLNNFKSIENDRQHRRISFRTKALAGVIISTVTALSVTALSVTLNPLPTISYKTSWLGNTFGGGSKWVQNQISGMYVASDGTVYTNSVWRYRDRRFCNKVVTSLAKAIDYFGVGKRHCHVRPWLYFVSIPEHSQYNSTVFLTISSRSNTEEAYSAHC